VNAAVAAPPTAPPPLQGEAAAALPPTLQAEGPGGDELQEGGGSDQAPDGLDYRLLNDFQHDFPLLPAPYAELAARLGCPEAEVLARLARLRARGIVSRVGAVFAPRRVGASTLAALAVPAGRLEAVAARVSAQPEVNHNYEREHAWNLWFVATAEDGDALARCLSRIRHETGCPVIPLPLEVEYHIDLGFDLACRPPTGAAGARPPAVPRPVPRGATPALAEDERRLMAALQDGLALVPRPFLRLAAQAGMGEGEVIGMLAQWLDSGILKRFGVVVRHHELGYQANAMCVWAVPDERADELGLLLAAREGVSLCYRRRRAKGWPYNLYCMIHGRHRLDVEACLAALVRDCGLAGYPAQVLFSRRRFKQRGAHYGAAPAERVHG
jgi:DNA-binding Lrp family transcriptional regulator